MKKELIPIEQIYVTGHRNPDTDSVVSAMAYAALRNAVGDRQYVAARLGHLSDETKLILSRFGFEAPVYLKTMRTQVLDLDYDVPPILHEAVTVGRAWEAMEADQHVSAIPITDDEGRLKGLYLHLSETLSTELRLTTKRLLGNQRVRTDRTGMHLVFNHVSELKHVNHAYCCRLVETVACSAIVEISLSVTGNACLVCPFVKIIERSSVEDWCREFFAKFTSCPAEHCLEYLTKVQD